MTTLSILRNTLKLNAAAIRVLELEAALLKTEARSWKNSGETAYFVSTCNDVRKVKAKVAKAVDLQKRIKAEIATIFRICRIERKYLLVFGKLPTTSTTTTYEQEAMLDTLLQEQAEGRTVYPNVLAPL